MKNLLLVMAFSFSFFSCVKTLQTQSEIDEDALIAVMSFNDVSQMKNAYELLKPIEKLELWSRHIRFFIQSRDLTEEQKVFVLKFKEDWLKKELFENNSPSLNNFNSALPKIKQNAQSILGVPDAYALLIDLQAYSHFYRKNIISENYTSNFPVNSLKVKDNTDQGSSCSCSTEDSYCNAGTCRNRGCASSKRGCGTLFLYPCDGICYLL